MPLRKLEVRYLKTQIEDNGLHDAMDDERLREEIEDPAFHQLRAAYLVAEKALLDYIGKDE